MRPCGRCEMERLGDCCTPRWSWGWSWTVGPCGLVEVGSVGGLLLLPLLLLLLRRLLVVG